MSSKIILKLPTFFRHASPSDLKNDNVEYVESEVLVPIENINFLNSVEGGSTVRFQNGFEINTLVKTEAIEKVLSENGFTIIVFKDETTSAIDEMLDGLQ